MKRGIRALSLLLLLAMLVGMLPAVSAQSKTDASLGGTELAYEGTTDFGNLLASDLSEYQAQQNEDPTWISDVEIVDGVALVDIALEQDATVLVCIYDEVSGEMVTSGNAQAGTMDSYVTIELDNLPQYYEVKVFVVDSVSYEPLCGVYTSTYYTQTMQEIIGMTVEDFDADQVLNLDDSTETNFAVYKKGTVVVYEESIKNRLSSVSGNKYQFMMPGSGITSLKAGDVLVFITQSEEIHIIKVASISSSRITATITADEEAELSDVFDYVKIEATLDGSTTTVNTDDMDQGVEYTGMETRNTRALAAGESLGTSIFFGFKFKDLEIVDGLTLNGSLGLTLNAKFEYYLASLDVTGSSDINHVRLELGYDAGIELSVKASFLEKEIKLAEIIVMNICGVNFLVRPYFVASAECEVSVSLTFSGTAGFEFRSKGFNYTVDDLYTKPKLKSELKMDGTIFVGVKLVPAITVICDDVGKIDLSAKAGLEIKASLVGTDIDSEPEDHSCSKCIDGSIRAKCTLTLGFNFLKVFRLDVDLVKYERFLADFYFSFDLMEFGFGSCPNNYADLPSLLDGVLKQASGTCGDDLKWEMYESGALYITGTGLMYDYSGITTETPWDDYTEDIVYVIIGEGAESVGGAAFNGCSNLFSVQLPSTLEYIERWAFADCSALEEIELPEHVEYIEQYAFAGCENLVSITLSDDLEIIHQRAFRDCSKLQSLDLPTGLEEIEMYAFSNCSSLRTVNFPYTLVEIGNSAFLDCTSLKEVDLPDRLEVLGEDAFQNCTSLETLYIGDGLTEIPNAVFYQCTALNDVWLGSNMEVIGYAAFWGCEALEYIEIPDSVTVIEEYAFIGCDSLNSVDFGESVEEIGYGAFKSCSSLEDVWLPDSVTYIGKFAFQDCSALHSIRLSANLETINTGAFTDCTSLLEIEMPDTVTTLADEAFMGCTALERAVMSNGLTKMGSSVFYDCSALTDVTIGTGLTELGNAIFWGCDSLSYIEIPGNIKALGSYTFISCDNLSTVVLNEGLDEIGYESFQNCTSLSEVTVPSTVTYVGKFAFSGCEALTSVRFTGDAPEFGTECFEDTDIFVYYPSNRSGWTSDIMLDYGGSVSWVAYTASGTSAARRSVSPAATRAVTVTTKNVTGLSNSARYLLVIAKSANEPLLASTNLIYVNQYISDKDGKLTVNWPIDATGYYIALYGESGIKVLQNVGGGTTTPSKPCDGGASCPSKQFTDVPGPSNWAHVGIDYAVKNQLFAGMSSTSFGPNVAMTRAMLVTVLWRYAGEPADGSNIFSDVPDGKWYTQAIAWAAKNNVVAGMGNGKFNPNGMVTREQMASILYRYAKSLGIDVSARADLSGFADSGKVSGWARESVQWAVAVGIVSGSPSGGKNYLQPQGNATRAQVASILMRFIENVVG